jgi:hypothetical protein
MNRLELMLNRNQEEAVTFRWGMERPEAQEVRSQVEEFLKAGGEVQKIPTGLSGETFKPKRTQGEIMDQMRSKEYRKAGKA